MSQQFLPEIYKSLKLGCDPNASAQQVSNLQCLPSFFDVSGLAAASFLAVGEALKSLLSSQYPTFTPALEVDQRLASLWFGSSLHLNDGQQLNCWDPIAGDYQTSNGWVRLHTNAPHHKVATFAVLNVPNDRRQVAKAVRMWDGAVLEKAVVEAGGCAAQMRSLDDWQEHSQGRAVRKEPLIAWAIGQQAFGTQFSIRDPQRPLKGLKVLDLTRVIAGPVATRTLAGLGAEVLRIDPEHWSEPGLHEELTIGKTCALINLKSSRGRNKFEQLVAQSDVLIHGLRADALPGLGLSIERLREINPTLIDVAHSAYGWTGPWANRRGFDSLVQMSAGIADFGMKSSHSKVPMPLPVQALDHATGYLVAAATLTAIKTATQQNCAVSARTSLARVAMLLVKSAGHDMPKEFEAIAPNDFTAGVERTHLGDAKRLKSAINISNIPQRWDIAAGPLRSSPAAWAA